MPFKRNDASSQLFLQILQKLERGKLFCCNMLNMYNILSACLTGNIVGSFEFSLFQIWFKNRRAKEKQLLRKGQADSSTSPSASSSTPRKPVATSKRKCTSRPAVHTITSADSATVKEENAPQTVYPDSDSVSSELLPSVSLMSTCTSASPSPPVTPASPFSYNFEYQRERTYAGIYDNFSNWHENSQYYGHNYHYAAYNQSYQQNWQGSHMQMGYTQGNTYQPNAASATYPMGAAAGYASHSNYGDQGAEHDVSYSYMQGTER